jgi:hypothetical protein
MSDEHGWPDFHDPGGADDAGHHGLEPQHDAGGDLPQDDSLFHDDLFGHDDSGPHGLDDLDGGHDLDDGPGGGDAHEPGWDDHEPGTGHDGEAQPHGVVDVTGGHGLGPVGADPDAVPDVDQVSLFPPVVDVGPLPEPVDGFPWIDTGSLGLVDAGVIDPAALQAAPVQAEDLAAYAAEDLPPGVDPWAALADSDDPATSTLAKWWSQGT